MKAALIASFLLASFAIHGQQATNIFDGHNWQAPYTLPVPKDWGVERFLLPSNFAPQIKYKGVEDIRFAPGWAKVNTDEYWTYAFIWYLDSLPQTDAAIIAENLKNYYTGLIKSNTDSIKATTEKPIPVTSSFNKAATVNDDLATYTGTINMLDYMQAKPITLNCILHVKFCKDLDKAILFYELSPQPFTHKNWTTLNQLWLDFKCKKG